MYKSKHTGNTIDEQIEKSLNGENIIENTVDYIDPLEPRPISSARIYKAIANEEFIPKDVLRIGNSLDDKRQKTYYGLKEYIRTIVPNITTDANDFFNIKKIQSIDDFTTVEISPNIVDLNEENNGFIDAEGFKKYINNLIEDYLKDKESIINALQNKLDESSTKALITSTLNYTREIIDDVDSLVLKSNDVIIGSISVADFIADRMLESVTPEEGTNNFIFTFKTGNGTTDSFKVDFTKYVDAYYADNQTLELDSKTKTFKVKENVFDKAGSANKVSQDLESYKQLVNASLTNKADSTGNYPDMSVGSAHDLTGRIEATPEEFKYRPSAGEKSIKDDSATIKRIKGNSLMWNSIASTLEEIAYNRRHQYDYDAATNTFSTNVENTQSNLVLELLSYKAKPIIGHKYLVAINGEYSNDAIVHFGNATYTQKISPETPQIVECTQSGYFYFFPLGTKPTVLPVGTSFTVDNVFLCDLTKMFGSGNEPATVDEFYARIPEGVDINAYNEGELINFTAESIKTAGFNQFNGVVVDGYINDANGEHVATTMYKCTDYIRVLSNQKYYINSEQTGGFWGAWYDSDKKFIKGIAFYGGEPLVTSPTNAAYMRMTILTQNAGGNPDTYCINLSHSGVRDGEYEPYKEFTHDLSWIKKYFPNGMRSAGSAYDEIVFDESKQKWVAIQRIGEVDLGTYRWFRQETSSECYSFYCSVTGFASQKSTVLSNLTCLKYTASTWSNAYYAKVDKIIANTERYIRIVDNTYTDADTFKSDLNGVILYYELAEPIVTPIEEIVNFSYEVGDFGTEEIISNGPTTPFKGDIVYQFNAVDRIRDNSRDIEKLNSEITNKVSAIRVNDRTITRKDGAGLLDIGDVSNLYVADFTIDDLDRLYNDGVLLSLEVNANALLQALQDGKAIGIREDNNISGGTPSMLIASAYKDDFLYLSVISSQAILYQVHIDCLAERDPSVEDAKSGIINFSDLEVIPIENPYLAPFSISDVTGTVTGYQVRFPREPFVQDLMKNKPLFISDTVRGGTAVVPASYSITKQDGNPTAIDIDIVYNNGLYHIHWGITDDTILLLNKDTVSYTQFSGEYIVTDFSVKGLSRSTPVTITEQFVKAIQSNARILIPITSPTDTNYVVVTTLQSSILADSFSIIIEFIYQAELYSVAFNGKGTVPSQVTPKITVTDLILKASSFKTINGESVIGSGDITALTGINNVFGQKISTINNGVLQPNIGDFAGLYTKPSVVSVSDTITLIAYFRAFLNGPIKNDITILFSGQKRLPNAEWELLFEVDSDTPVSISIDARWIGSTVIRCKDNGITLSSLSRGYYRLKAITTHNYTNCLIEIDRFN